MDHKPAPGPARAHHLSESLVRWPAPERLAETLAREAVDAAGMLVCSDFDGTLAPIAATPAAVRPLAAADAAIAWLTRAGAAGAQGAAVPVRFAVVTSRDSDDVARRLSLGPEAMVSGCGGLEVWRAGRVEVIPAVRPHLPALRAATAQLEEALDGGRFPGARLERKRCATVLHTRGVARPALEAEVMELARGAARRQGLGVIGAKRALELRPPVQRDKANAVCDLREDGWGSAMLCAAGDDLPDVEMLQLAAEARPGCAVAVADVETPRAVLHVTDVAVEGPWSWAATLGALVARLRR